MKNYMENQMTPIKPQRLYPIKTEVIILKPIILMVQQVSAPIQIIDNETVTNSRQASPSTSQQQVKSGGIFEFFSPALPPLKAHTSLLSDKLLLGVRVVGLLFFTATYILIFLYNCSSLLEHFLYLTFYGYFITWLYFLSAVQARIFGISLLDKYIEVLFQLAVCFEVTITIMYWTVLHDGGQGLDLYFDVAEHAVPLAFLLVDWILNSFRFVPSQALLLVAAIWIYLLICSLPFSLAAYPVYNNNLSWKSGKSYILIAISNVLCLLTFLLGRVFFNCCKKAKLYGSESDEQAQPSTAQIMQS